MQRRLCVPAVARACRDRGEVVRGVFWRGCGWIYPSSDQLMDVEREQKKKKKNEEEKKKIGRAADDVIQSADPL